MCKCIAKQVVFYCMFMEILMEKGVKIRSVIENKRFELQVYHRVEKNYCRESGFFFFQIHYKLCARLCNAAY